MQLDPKLRERILRVLRFAVPALEGTYEHKEAVQLLHELEQGTMFLGNESNPDLFTEEQCYDEGFQLGWPKQEIEYFYLWYSTQGWVKGNDKRVPASKLRELMRLWQLREKRNNAEPEPVRNNQGLTPRQMDALKRGR